MSSQRMRRGHCSKVVVRRTPPEKRKPSRLKDIGLKNCNDIACITNIVHWVKRKMFLQTVTYELFHEKKKYYELSVMYRPI